MLRLALKLLLAGAALAAIWAFVPFGGRTLSDRWASAGGPEEFLGRTWAEMRGAPRPHGGKPQARSGQAAPARGAERPSEGHTDADRRALDRVLSQHLGESR
jgi:hypothetical protein